MLLAYYMAAVNIETTYHALAGKTAATDDYEPLQGIVLADTFQISESGATPINVIVGNPPYSVRQTSANDLNAT